EYRSATLRPIRVPLVQRAVANMCRKTNSGTQRFRFDGGASKRPDRGPSQMHMFQTTTTIFGTAELPISKMPDGRNGPRSVGDRWVYQTVQAFHDYRRR